MSSVHTPARNPGLASAPFISHIQSFVLCCFAPAMVSYGEQVDLSLRMKMKWGKKPWSAHCSPNLSPQILLCRFRGNPTRWISPSASQLGPCVWYDTGYPKPCNQQAAGPEFIMNLRKGPWSRRQPHSISHCYW